MSDMKEVEESGEDKPQSVEKNPDAEAIEQGESDNVKVMDVGEGEEKNKEGVEEVEEEEEEEEEEEVGEDGEEEGEEEDDEEEETESEEVEEDDSGKNMQTDPGSEDVSNDGKRELHVEVPLTSHDEDMDSAVDAAKNSNEAHMGNVVSSANGDGVSEEVHVAKDGNSNHVDGPSLKSSIDEKPPVNDGNESLGTDTEKGNDVKLNAHDSANDQSVDDEIVPRRQAAVGAPNDGSSAVKVEHMKEELKNEEKTREGAIEIESSNLSQPCIFDTDTTGGGESGTEDEQAAFMIELEKFHKEKCLDFKPPKFYGEPLNLLKLWRAVIKLGGYDKVTACKYWRQVGESFKPPKTCTTVSWTFRIFYEKALLEYERYRTSGDGPSMPASLSVPMNVENQASGSGRARRDAAARAMQGWHSQRILDNGEVSDPIIKDKNSISLNKKEKQLKNLGVLKRKKPTSMDVVKDIRTKVPKTQSETTVIDIGSPADWVKINVRVTKDCYEVYALVPGLLREEVRVQSDPAGRLVISGEPENPDNPWCVTPFKKVVNLPSRIDPHQTSAVVTLHGQLFVRVPFEQCD